MSHLSLMSIELQSFYYLQKSLNRISQNFSKSDKEKKFEFNQLDFLQGKLAKYAWGNLSMMAIWKKTAYNLILDKEMFAKNFSSNADLLLQNVTQVYAIEALIGESSVIGFEPLSYKQNVDGSKTIVLERVSELKL